MIKQILQTIVQKIFKRTKCLGKKKVKDKTKRDHCNLVFGMYVLVFNVTVSIPG